MLFFLKRRLGKQIYGRSIIKEKWRVVVRWEVQLWMSQRNRDWEKKLDGYFDE